MIIRHKATGGMYIILTEARNESKPDEILVIYRAIGNNADPHVWARPKAQMYDGRFDFVHDGHGMLPTLKPRPTPPEGPIEHHSV